MALLRLFITLSLLCTAASTVAADKITSLLPARSERLEGYDDVDSLRRRLGALPLHFVEGIWSLPADGAEFAVERTAPSATMSAVRYRIVVLRTTDRAVRPGTVMGIMTPAADGEYDAAIYTSIDADGQLRSPRQFTLKLRDDNSAITIKRVKSRYSLEPHRLLPYLFRRVIRSRYGDNGSATMTAVRQFPDPVIPLSPRYL